MMHPYSHPHLVTPSEAKDLVFVKWVLPRSFVANAPQDDKWWNQRGTPHPYITFHG